MKAVRGTAAVGFAIVLAAVVLAPAFAQSPVRYEGQLEDGQGDVQLALRAPSSAAVKFAISPIRLRCDDGSTLRVLFRRERAVIGGNGRFYKDGVTPDRTGGVYVWSFEGRLKGRTATGHLLAIYNQGPVEQGFPDCSTEGKLAWSAARR